MPIPKRKGKAHPFLQRKNNNSHPEEVKKKEGEGKEKHSS